MGKQSRKTRLTKTDRRKNRPTIGYFNMMITGDWALQPWLGIGDAARERDVSLVTFVGGNVRRSQANVIYDLARGGRLDGLIIWNAGLVSELTEAEIKAFCEQYGIPIVTLEGTLAGSPCVTYENYLGLRRLAEHLIQVHGYRKIGFVGMLEHHEGFHERYRGYADAMQAHGLPIDPTLARPWFPREQLASNGRIEAHTFNDYIDNAMALGMEAVICIADDIAYQALEELEKRGIRVPEQVAVVGFDDSFESRVITPPLTTIKAPFYELGYTAAETLLDLLAGKSVPELVSVPATLTVRQSCGCQDPYVATATTKPIPALATSPAEAAFIHPDIAAAMGQTTQAGEIESIQHEIEPLLARFAAELTGEKTGGFLDALGEALHQSANTVDELTKWHGVLSALRQQILPQLTPNAPETRQAEDLLQQAQVLISRVAERTQMLRNLRAAEKELDFQRVSVSLLATLDVNTLMDTLANELPGLGIPSCYLSFFEDPRPYQYPDPAPEWARLVLAYGPQGRMPLESPGQRFPARRLIPDELWPQDRACSFVLLSLHLQEEQIGFVLFESGSRRGSMYEILQTQISSALQGALLVRQVEHRALQLQTAAEVSRAASGTLDPDELIQQAVELVRERFDLYYAGLFLVDQTGKWAVLRAGTGKAGQKMVKQGHKLEVGGGSMIGWCIANKQARIALDVGAEAVRFEHPLLPKTRSELALPLISRGEVVGALTSQSAQEAAFSDEDVTVLQTMADQLANAIQSARLFEQAQTRTAELAVLNEMTRALTATLDVGTMLENVYDHTSRLMDTSNLYVALYDAQKDEVSFAFYRVDGKPIEQVESRRAGKGLTEYVLRTRQPFLIEENIATQLKELGIEMIGREAQSWLGAPMIAGDQVIGVIAVQSYTTSHVYNEHHRDLLSAIANQAAIAIQNARLFAQAQIRAAELIVLNELGQALATRLSINEVLDEVYRGASRLVDATNFYIALYHPDSHEVTFPFDSAQEQGDRFLALPADQGLTGYIIRHRTSVLIEEDVPGWLAERGIEMVGEPALSWLGVPMMRGDQVLGVMGLQSFTTPRAYDEHDRDLLAALATQTASAITNARLFEQTQTALAEVEATQRRYLERVWGEYARVQEVSGYVHTGAGLTPLDDTLLPEVQQAMRERRTTILEDGGSSVLVVPVTLRGQPLGALGVKIEGGEERWGAEDIALVEGIGEQFALAAENIRLMDETQRRATRERLVGEVATRVRETLDLERVLRTATDEIYKALGLERVMIRLKMAGDGAERQDLAAGGEERETAQEEAT